MGHGRARVELTELSCFGNTEGFCCRYLLMHVGHSGAAENCCLLANFNSVSTEQVEDSLADKLHRLFQEEMDEEIHDRGPAAVIETKTPTEHEYITGWRFVVVTCVLVPLPQHHDVKLRYRSLGLAVYLVTMEASIVATTLVPIADDLHAFDRTSWIVTAYLLTYTGFLIIFAKLSDIFGRKSVLLSTLGLFIVFSGACAAAQSIEQL
jgi:hypothetical protein